MPSSLEPRFTLRGSIMILSVIVLLALASLLTNYRQEVKALLGAGRLERTGQVHVATDNDGHYLALPELLLKSGIYQNDSFANEAGIVPAYWEGKGNQTAIKDKRPTLGPCYRYKKQVNWEEEIAKYNRTGQPEYNVEQITSKNAMNLEGFCRPGFLIIGAGKCGTSSLYHYVSSHPKVLPASEKQIHYFKYHKHEPLKWYYHHFPSTASFLAAGALMTGEASPGYLPYPDVVMDMKETMPEPKLLAIGRNPLERAYSSYKYNYVDPHTKILKKGKLKQIARNQPDSFYQQYLFSFEDMMRAELAVLRECFAPGSEPQKATRRKWGRVYWVQKELKRRENQALPPLIDLDGYCYGGKVNSTVLRQQWASMVAEQPGKIILGRNTHLTQSLIGRSLYLFPLEWWYAAFPAEHIYFVCTEELEDFSGESMNSVGEFLGLPRYDNFAAVVQQGVYNAGGHKGYDNEIPWTQLKNEHRKDDLPLSEEFRLELEEFVRPYNERLFNLTGRRCNW